MRAASRGGCRGAGGHARGRARGVAIAAPRAASTTAQGTTLVKRFFDLLTKQDKGGLQKFLSPAFQLQGADGGFLDKRALVANRPKSSRTS